MRTGDLNGKRVMIQILSAKLVLASVKNVEPNLGIRIMDDSGDWIDAAHVSQEIQKPAFFVPWASVAWIAVESTF